MNLYCRQFLLLSVFLGCTAADLVSLEDDLVSLNQAIVHAPPESRYSTGSLISISFEIEKPHDEDVIALIPISTPLISGAVVETPVQWLYTCGDRSCKAALSSGNVSFGTQYMQTGTYQAVLGRWKGGSDHKMELEIESIASRTFSFQETPACQTIVIGTDKSCYEEGEDIHVRFDGESCHQDSDKIAMVGGHEVIPDSAHPSLWLYTCGDKDCADVSEDESKDLEPSAPSWPLPTGLYKAVLIRSNPGSDSSQVVFESHPFRVESECLYETMNQRYMRGGR